MTAPPAVVLFTSSFVMGGMEEHVLQLGRGLVERGATVAALCSPVEDVRPLRDELAQAGVHVHAVAEQHGSKLDVARRLRELAAVVRRYPGSILHLHITGHEGGELVMLAGRLGGARALIRTEHLPPVPPIGARERALVHLRDRFLDRVICVSRSTHDDHIQLLGRDPDKIVAVPNCIDLEKFSPHAAPDGLRAELGIEPDTPIVGTVSRFGERRKGNSYFLQMAASLATNHPRARFLLAGDGPLRSELEAEARELGIADRVFFTGDRRDIPRVLSAMTVFVMPSLYEGGPYTVLEAMGCGVPTVSTPVGLVPDAIVHGESGFLVPPADAAALATAVRRLLADPGLRQRFARNGRAVVEQRFSAAAMVEGVVEVYRDVLRQRGATREPITWLEPPQLKPAQSL